MAPTLVIQRQKRAICCFQNIPPSIGKPGLPAASAAPCILDLYMPKATTGWMARIASHMR